MTYDTHKNDTKNMISSMKLEDLKLNCIYWCKYMRALVADSHVIEATMLPETCTYAHQRDETVRCAHRAQIAAVTYH